MKRIMILMTLFMIGSTYLQADEGGAQLTNESNNYEAEKLERTTISNPDMENQTEKDISSDSGVQIIEPSLMTNPTSAGPVPQEKSYRPPS
jgi:hypothetical protein